MGTVDVTDAEPVGKADDGAEVAGVLDVVEHEAQAGGGCLGQGGVVGLLPEDGKHRLGRLLGTDAAEFVIGDDVAVGREAGGKLRVVVEPLAGGCEVTGREMRQQIGDELPSLCHEDSVGCALLLEGKRADVFYSVFGEHRINLLGKDREKKKKCMYICPIFYETSAPKHTQNDEMRAVHLRGMYGHGLFGEQVPGGRRAAAEEREGAVSAGAETAEGV